MIPILARSAVLALVIAGLNADPGGAQEAAVASYYGAVGEHFGVPSHEVMILSEWRLPEAEIPVVLFLADRGGISSEAVVALRRGGEGWAALARRYGLDADDFHMALEGGPGSLARVYERYRTVPRREWATLELRDEEIVGLVNMRVLSAVLGVAPQAVLQAYDRSGSWVRAYAALAGR